MQNVIIRYVEDLKVQLEATGCSIATAIGVELPKMNRARLLAIRDAALDLIRIVELEIQRRDENGELVTYYGCCRCQSYHFEGDPLYRPHIFQQSKHGLQQGRRPDSEASHV